jgi:hypothetical protein
MNYQVQENRRETLSLAQCILEEYLFRTDGKTILEEAAAKLRAVRAESDRGEIPFVIDVLEQQSEKDLPRGTVKLIWHVCQRVCMLNAIPTIHDKEMYTIAHGIRDTIGLNNAIISDAWIIVAEHQNGERDLFNVPNHCHRVHHTEKEDGLTFFYQYGLLTQVEFPQQESIYIDRRWQVKPRYVVEYTSLEESSILHILDQYLHYSKEQGWLRVQLAKFYHYTAPDDDLYTYLMQNEEFSARSRRLLRTLGADDSLLRRASAGIAAVWGK